MAKLVRFRDGTSAELIPRVNLAAVDGLGAELSAINDNFQEVASKISTTNTELSNFKSATEPELAANKNDITTLKASSHTHSNKAALDKVTQQIIDKILDIDSGANKYIHPTFAATTIGESANKTLTWGSTFLLPQIGRDAEGHLSVINARTITMPANPNVNTTYTAGTGLTLNGTTFNHSNSITAGNGGPSANATLAYGGTFTVPYFTYDAQGHITGRTNRTLTMPAIYTHPNYGTASTYGPTANVSTAGSSFVVPQFTTNAQGHITAVTNRTMTFPSAYSHPTFTSSTVGPSANVTLTYGGTFTVPRVGRDTNGHASTLTNYTLTLPNVPSTFETTNIPANANLNNYTTPGYYYCPASATVATFTNCPTTNAFAMIVTRHAGYNQKIIEYHTNATTSRIYMRNYYSNAWGSWYQIYHSGNLPSTTLAVGGLNNTGNWQRNGTTFLTSAGALSNITTITQSGNHNTTGGAYQVNGTTVISNARALSNITSATISSNFNTTGGGYQINGTTVVNTSRALTNITAINNTGNWQRNGTTFLTNAGDLSNITTATISTRMAVSTMSVDGSTIRRSTGFISICSTLLSVANYANTAHVPVNAASFNVASEEQFKENIEEYQGGIDIIANTHIYSYNLKEDLEKGIDDTKYGVVIGDDYSYPSEIITKDDRKDSIATNYVDVYSMASLGWKAIQEMNGVSVTTQQLLLNLIERVEELENERKSIN